MFFYYITLASRLFTVIRKLDSALYYHSPIVSISLHCNCKVYRLLLVKAATQSKKTTTLNSVTSMCFYSETGFFFSFNQTLPCCGEITTSLTTYQLVKEQETHSDQVCLSLSCLHSFIATSRKQSR